ncbi:MAG: nucleotidyltransferase domain-containing protein [Methanotrichaceae archaeon]|nr:nucleotidyltransferase domain-containing protein [Methanotrichaceae archaeon]
MIEQMSAALDDEVRLQLAPVVQSLQQGLGERLVSVVLFGSRARGDAEGESDWNLLAIARDLPQCHFERQRGLKALLLPEWRGRSAILAKTPEEFEAALHALYLEIALDGLILYDTESYAKGRLLRLQHLLQSKGLRREVRGKEFRWMLETFPGFGWSLACQEA